jgi:TolB-like protein
MNVHRRIDRLARLLCIVAIVAFLPGCLTPRTAFETVGEIPLADPAATADIHAWTGGKQGHGGIVQESDKAGTFFRFPSSGWSTLAGSLVGDLRMSFSVRLEAPVEYEIPTAMLNFRNYFDRRYCFLVEPTCVSLLVARVHHGELAELARFAAETATNAWYAYEIVAVGPALKVFRNGRLIIDLVDKGPSIGEGNIAFESHSKYSFRDVDVARITDFRKKENIQPEQPQPVAAIPLPKEKLTVAVSGFENRGVEEYAASLITDLYASALLSTGVFRVVERSQTARVLAEQEFQLSDVADAAHAVTIGRILNTKYLSCGSVGMLGGTYVLTVAVVDVETGETLASFNRSFADTERIPASLDELCAEIARKVLAR